MPSQAIEIVRCIEKNKMVVRLIFWDSTFDQERKELRQLIKEIKFGHRLNTQYTSDELDQLVKSAEHRDASLPI